MELAGAGIGCFHCLWQPITQKINDVKNVEKNAETLRRNTEELSARENDIRVEMNRAVVQLGKKSNSEVEIWLKNVEQVTHEVSTIDKDLCERTKWFKGCLPNFYSRSNLGKVIKEKQKEVVELKGKGAFPNGLFRDPLPERGRTIPTTTLIGTTARLILERIWHSLMDAEVKIIGIYGMGGVGKTAVMMHVNNQLNGAYSFDNFIWVTVSKTSNLEKLQNDIAKAMDLDLSEDKDEISRASKLFVTLLRKKRFVLMLDDLWCKFPLEKVGIPQPNKENGCKLVFTTRLMEVCRGMETQREIKVELLSKEVAWDLFKDKVGADAIFSPEIEATAKQITEECGGLPLAIITVGRALRKVDNIRVLRNALEELRNSKAEIEGMEDDVFARLKFSYNHLKNDTVKACLLYCALYPADKKIDIEELIEYWMAEGLIDEVGDREKEINKGHSILNELKDACMVESIGAQWIKMHDLVRDLAINITRIKPLFMTEAGNGLRRFPVGEKMEEVERISLMDNSIDMLSDHLKCTKLSTLLLQRNPLSRSISHSFFEHMDHLRVLDLSDTRLKLLPDSVSNLQNLRALLLRFCELKKIPSLGLLSKLRVLDLSYTNILRLPNDIGRLVYLRRLDLSYTEKLRAFPTEVISKFFHLENLSMFKSGWRWSLDTVGTGRGVGLGEIMNSRRLAHLGISFHDLSSFIRYVRSEHWRTLRSYHLGIGLLSRFSSISKGDRAVEIQGCNLVSDGSSIVLPDNTLQLALQGCDDISCLSKLPCISNLSELQECYISRCNRVAYIGTAEENCLSSLERLVLRKLPNLAALYNGISTSSSFARLAKLHIHSCDGLKNLFSARLLQSIQNLEEIEIWSSLQIEEVVVEEEIRGPDQASTSKITLQKLRRLYFFSLPELRSICTMPLLCHSLNTIDVWDCRMLKKLPLSIENIPVNLKYIRGSRKWWDALEWDDDKAKTFFQDFFREDREEGEQAEDDDDKEDNKDQEADEDEDDDSDDDIFERGR